ncbi:MAG: beta-ketoacyl-ACP synthase II [FCB group bacterium]|nr:beta-ketoacyl-ACP synthase II [FCB group bacterium]
MHKRVVITGMGIISPIGNNLEENWKNVTTGNSGIRTLTVLDPEQFTSKIAGEVKDFDPLQYLDRKQVKRADKYTQFALIAANEAFVNSGIEGHIEPERLGVLIGSGIGGISTIEDNHQIALEKGSDRIKPYFIPMMIGNMAAGLVGIEMNAKGPNLSTVTACASSGHGIALATDLITLGKADAILTGGSEAPLTMMGIGGFCALKALSTRNDDPATASRPFDKDRDGFVIAEGGAAIVLEEYEHACARGADIIAEVTGSGMTCDAFHITAPAEGGEGSYRSMKIAMDEAGIDPEEVDYINAHGTSTLLNDRNETTAIRTLLGDFADKVMVSSTKSMTGHLLGAAGAAEIIYTAMALKEGIVPPTATLQNPGEGCDLDYVPVKARKRNIMNALSNSLGFGGHNVTIALRRYTEK